MTYIFGLSLTGCRYNLMNYSSFLKMQNKSQFGLSDFTINELNSVFKKYPKIEKVVIFGSRAMGNYKKGSDIDLALFGEELSISDLMDIQYELDEESPLPYYFDCVLYSSLKNDNLRNHIDEHGCLLFVPRNHQHGIDQT